MKTIISLTSIPSRFGTLHHIVSDLLCQQNIDEIWVNLPEKYNRFPDVDVQVPEELYKINSKIKINRCKDYGPGTMYIAPALSSDADLIIVVNDDTKYPPNLSSELINAYKSENCCWCLSGFKIDGYIKGQGRVQYIHNQKVDVTESYGGVILKREWIKQILEEFNEFYKITYNDDVIVGNLFAKHGITKKTISTPSCNIGQIKQYSFGMGPDALFQNNGEGTHFKNNERIFNIFKEKKIFYFK